MNSFGSNPLDQHIVGPMIAELQYPDSELYHHPAVLHELQTSTSSSHAHAHLAAANSYFLPAPGPSHALHTAPHTHIGTPGPMRPDVQQRKRPKYTRSKTGCLTCRQKKVKCDEERPACMRCTQSGRDCTWPEDVSISRKRSLPRQERHPATDSSESASQSNQSEPSTPVSPVVPIVPKPELPSELSPPELHMTSRQPQTYNRNLRILDADISSRRTISINNSPTSHLPYSPVSYALPMIPELPPSYASPYINNFSNMYTNSVNSLTSTSLRPTLENTVLPSWYTPTGHVSTPSDPVGPYFRSQDERRPVEESPYTHDDHSRY